MMTPSNYHLSFDKFPASTSRTFQNLLNDAEFTDVTLVCEDDIQIEAHKVILSSSSSFFHRILLKNPHQHPLIYITGIKHRELERIIHFIYKGETDVAKDDLENFMRSAKELEISELLTSEDDLIVEISGNDAFKSDIKAENVETLIEDFEQQEDTSVVEFDNETGGNHHVIIEENARSETNIKKQRITSEEKDDDKNLKKFICKNCDYRTNAKAHFYRHIARHPENNSAKFECDDCVKQFNSNEALKYHKKSVHDGVRFTCSYCNHTSSSAQNLKRHDASKHTN